MAQTSHCFEGCQTTLNWKIFFCLDVKFDKIKRPKDMPFYLMNFLQTSSESCNMTEAFLRRILSSLLSNYGRTMNFSPKTDKLR